MRIVLVMDIIYKLMQVIPVMQAMLWYLPMHSLLHHDSKLYNLS